MRWAARSALTLALAHRTGSTGSSSSTAGRSLDPHTARCFDARLALLRMAAAREAYLDAQPLFLYPADWISDQ